ncbi:uncharacterized protein LTHEOB_12838 [Lasiodiplodia theobromae]|uniref:Uncharacterized protein n=1 Tax=Lasiodiplodia theobromae TaxID=45133 RepID=A0A5N5CXA3_9PEZI|nr:uncharacterized protein LTHEOB_12838 [Lasiodiplodia theobromae]KAB2569936.1 hypothetical protein DBV05_g11413 [Lasiodiplodia theobromae]KAF4535061.1 hypothetical protein LTHEOB_12838 [Lasiodiplodia theobromae]
MSVPRPRTVNLPPNWPAGYPSVVNKDERHIQQDSFTLHRGHYGVIIETEDFDDGTTIVKPDDIDTGTSHPYGSARPPQAPVSASGPRDRPRDPMEPVMSEVLILRGGRLVLCRHHHFLPLLLLLLLLLLPALWTSRPPGPQEVD